MATMQSGLKGTNLFEYCENNYLNNIDSNGKWPWSWSGTVSLSWAPTIINIAIICITALSQINKLMRQYRKSKNVIKTIKKVFKESIWRIKKHIGKFIRKVIKNRKTALAVERIVLRLLNYSMNALLGLITAFGSLGHFFTYLIDCCDAKRDNKLNFRKLRFSLCSPF
jgi:hypothetical protein